MAKLNEYKGPQLDLDLFKILIEGNVRLFLIYYL